MTTILEMLLIFEAWLILYLIAKKFYFSACDMNHVMNNLCDRSIVDVHI